METNPGEGCTLIQRHFRLWLFHRRAEKPEISLSQPSPDVPNTLQCPSVYYSTVHKVCRGAGRTSAYINSKAKQACSVIVVARLRGEQAFSNHAQPHSKPTKSETRGWGRVNCSNKPSRGFWRQRAGGEPLMWDRRSVLQTVMPCLDHYTYPHGWASKH